MFAVNAATALCRGVGCHQRGEEKEEEDVKTITYASLCDYIKALSLLGDLSASKTLHTPVAHMYIYIYIELHMILPQGQEEFRRVFSFI